MTLEWRYSTALDRFPSASSIAYHEGRFYIFGDDAPYLLVTDTALKPLDTARFHVDTSFRIGKASKPDVESSTIIREGGRPLLMAAGSFSSPARRYLFYFPLPDIHSHRTVADSFMAQELQPFPDPNIEGCTAMGNGIVYAQRANNTQRQNYLLAGNHPLGGSRPLRKIKLMLPGNGVAGLSGLHYMEDADMLLFTASEEDTPSAWEDGAIKDSYLGFIFDAGRKMKDSVIRPDTMVRLRDLHPSMARQKVESVCSIREGRHRWKLFLVSDNDDGHSGFFSLSLRQE